MSGRASAIFIWLIAAVIAGNTYVMWRVTFQEFKMRSWNAIDGTITVVSDSATIAGEGVEYKYEVDGKEYIGHRIAINDWHLPKSWVDTQKTEWIKEKYPIGTSVEVYYDPDVPGKSVLIKKTTSEGDELGGPVMFTLFAIFAVGLGIYKWFSGNITNRSTSQG